MKLKDLKNFKYWGRELKIAFIADIIHNLLNLIAAIVLYITLNNTGLLIYIIFMLYFRWKREDES